MSEINPALSQEAEFRIQQEGTAAAQMEIGVLKTTVIMLEKRVAVMLEQRKHDLELIEALRKNNDGLNGINRTVVEENENLRAQLSATPQRRGKRAS